MNTITADALQHEWMKKGHGIGRFHGQIEQKLVILSCFGFYKSIEDKSKEANGACLENSIFQFCWSFVISCMLNDARLQHLGALIESGAYDEYDSL